MPEWTAEVLESNRMKAAEEKIQFAGGVDTGSGSGPIKHVIYIIKENRTYDQIFGDLKQNGKAVGNGDASLTMYGEDVTPNEHKLALQFGVLDNFYDSGEVSGDGHVWSNGGDWHGLPGEDRGSRTTAGAARTYDFEGVVADGYPLLQKIPDVNEPASGYLWGNLASAWEDATITLASTSLRRSAMRRRAEVRRRGRCWKACIARIRRSSRARRFLRSGVAA